MTIFLTRTLRAGVFRIIECSIALIVSSATALHRLWTKTTVISTLYARVKTSIYQKSLHKRGQESPDATAGRGTSEEAINNPMESVPMNREYAYMHSTANGSPVPSQAVALSNMEYAPVMKWSGQLADVPSAPPYVISMDDSSGWRAAGHRMD